MGRKAVPDALKIKRAVYYLTDAERLRLDEALAVIRSSPLAVVKMTNGLPAPTKFVTGMSVVKPAFTSADCMRQRKCLRKGEDCPAGQCLGGKP